MRTKMYLPIAMLHYVSDDTRFEALKPYCISQKSFVRLLDVIEESELKTKTFYSISECERHSDFKRSIVLSFDDCPKHLFDFVVPELLRRKMKACFYVPTANIGNENIWDSREGKPTVEIMGASDLKALSQAGMEIGSHSHDHIRLGVLADRQEIVNQLKTSKRIIEEVCDKRVVSMAYPFGSVPAGYQEILQEADFEFGLGIFHPRECKFALRRFIYHDGDDKKAIKKKLSFFYRLYRIAMDRTMKYDADV